MTSIPANVDYDFGEYGVLAVFYKGCAPYGDELRQEFFPKVSWVRESVAGDLSATITLKEAECSPREPQLWGMYVLTIIDKRSLDRRPKTLHVTRDFQT